MSNRSQLENVLSLVSSQAKLLFSDKLKTVILFGSYARGDFDSESDVDIMILADITDGEINSYTRKLYDMIYNFELETDSVLSLCIVPEERFNKFKSVLPFYRNVDREGVKIAV